MKFKAFHVEGTGKVLMEKRWFIVHDRTMTIPDPTSVDWSVSTKKEGEKRIAAIKRNNPSKWFEEIFPLGLALAQWWCFPRSYHPHESVKPLPTVIVIDITDNSGPWRLCEPIDPLTVKHRETTWVFPTDQEEHDWTVDIIKEAVLDLFPDAEFIVLPMLSKERNVQIRARIERKISEKKAFLMKMKAEEDEKEYREHQERMRRIYGNS